MIIFNVKNILISACHLTFTIIFYYHAVMNTFIQWQETISDAYLTYTPSYFPFIKPKHITPSPRKPRKHTKQRFDFSEATAAFKATFHLTISMRGKRATGKIQRNNYRHGSSGLSLTGKTMSVFLIFTQGTHRNVKHR